VPFKFIALLLIPAAFAGAQSRVPVVVELFTSEGCSSCPPADKLLAEIERTQPVANAEILVLSEHLDYWNRLGWRDPFSSAQFSRRQGEYAGDAYTPEMVVDGRAKFVGSNAREAIAAIQQAAGRSRAVVVLSRDAAGLIVNIEGIPAKADTEVYLAITETGLRSNVTSGENAGRLLDHTGVVRSLTVIGKTKGGSFSKQAALPAGAHTRAIVFVQDRRTREILGASSMAL
jgi:hypothetical protein